MGRLLELIEHSTDILILPHVGPDGDAIGSSVGLKTALVEMGKNVQIVSNSDLPFFYYELFDGEIQKECTIKPTLAIALDSSDIGRITDRKELYEGLSLVNIDHHITNEYYGDLNIVDEKASSTGELLYKVITQELGQSISQKTAKALYSAIVSDTGSFIYSNTRPETFECASKLLETGFDKESISIEMYQSTPMEKFKLMSMALADAQFYYAGKLGITQVTQKMMKECGTTNTDDIAEQLRNIKGVEVSALIIEKEKEIKVSMRSKSWFDLASLSKANGGGGHMRAAGYSVIDMPIEKVREKVIKEASDLNG